jgi:hypothetical protein
MRQQTSSMAMKQRILLTFLLLLNLKIVVSKAFLHQQDLWHITRQKYHFASIPSTASYDMDDTKDFHQFAAAAVDLSNAHVSKSGLLSGKVE